MMVGNRVLALVIAIRSFLEGLDNVRLKPYLAEWPSEYDITRAILPHELPILSCLSVAVKTAGEKTEHMVKMLASLSNYLTWGQTYSLQDVGVGFLEKYGWTEFIGLRGPIASKRIACGMLFLGPQVEYPRHWHTAEEVYVPLAGKALWQQGNQAWAYREIGQPIYHATEEPHAMRTYNLPLMALYLWRGGNLVQKSKFAAAHEDALLHPAHG
jgi:hypothetical protein